MNEATAAATIAIATANVANGAPMQSSAVLCLSDARSCLSRGDFGSANSRALASLSYSVGCLHPAWREAKALLG